MKRIKLTEEQFKNILNEEDKKNYMFFQNLRQIKEQSEELLSMDESNLDNILSSGHDWASDHITTAKDDVEEVYHFFKHGETIREDTSDDFDLMTNSEKKMKHSKLIQLIREEIYNVLSEKDREKDWREDSSWEDDDSIITLGDVVDYLGDNVRNISVSDLQNKLESQLKNVTKEKGRLKKADLQYPIILVQEDGEFSYVLDGNHRLQKAIVTGEEYIKAKVLDLDDENTPQEFKRLLTFK